MTYIHYDATKWDKMKDDFTCDVVRQRFFLTYISHLRILHSPICASWGRYWLARVPPATSSFRFQAWDST